MVALYGVQETGSIARIKLLDDGRPMVTRWLCNPTKLMCIKHIFDLWYPIKLICDDPNLWDNNSPLGPPEPLVRS